MNAPEAHGMDRCEEEGRKIEAACEEARRTGKDVEIETRDGHTFYASHHVQRTSKIEIRPLPDGETACLICGDPAEAIGHADAFLCGIPGVFVKGDTLEAPLCTEHLAEFTIAWTARIEWERERIEKREKAEIPDAEETPPAGPKSSAERSRTCRARKRLQRNATDCNADATQEPRLSLAAGGDR